MNEIIEIKILEKVRELLNERVNEVLNTWQNTVPLFELSEFKGRCAVVPKINITFCERTEKERIVLLDAYSLSISFNLQDTEETELYCYAYINAVKKVIEENPTLGGVVDRAAILIKKITPPKVAHCGMEWEAVISLRITVEEIANAG